MSQIADLLSRQLGTKSSIIPDSQAVTIVSLKWTADESQPSALAHGKRPDPPAPFSGSALVTAIQEQLGLELQLWRGQVETLAIDHAEKPAEN